MFQMILDRSRLTCLWLSLVVNGSWSTAGVPVNTAFTYQGQLKDGGIPANGPHNFVFRLFNDSNVQIGADIAVNGHPVVNGLFSADLDFGPGVFTGDKRELEVQVDGVILTPRQPLNAAPYAMYALNGPGGTGPWTVNGAHIHNTNSGNVGIGTTAPTSPLHLSGSAQIMEKIATSHTAGAWLELENTSLGGKRWGVISTGSANGEGAGKMLLRAITDGRSVMTLQGDGKVGIGTGAPLDELHVRGSNATLRLEDNDPDTPRNSSSFTLFEDAQPTQLRISKTNSSGSVFLDLNPKPSDGVNSGLVRFFRETNTAGVKGVRFYRGNNTTELSALIGVDGADSALQIHGGRLGIGTSAPAANLEVRGFATPRLRVAHMVGQVGAAGTGVLELKSNRVVGNLVAPHGAVHFLDENDAVLAGIEHFGAGFSPGMHFVTNSASRMVIRPDGKVGIGTSTVPAGVRLAVDGKLLCEEVEVQLSQDWPDYVFEDDYAIMPLDELERTIRRQKHLPGIPSATKVKAEGIAVGAMQASLLEKVEELTLYVIQLNDRIDETQSENRALRQQLAALERADHTRRLDGSEAR
jgi:hypothetical protein